MCHIDAALKQERLHISGNSEGSDSKTIYHD